MKHDIGVEVFVARQHLYLSEEHGGGWVGSSTKTDQNVPGFYHHEKMSVFII
jgi:hypothetical protein